MRKTVLLGTGGTIACDARQKPLSPVFSARTLLSYVSDSDGIKAEDLEIRIDSTEMTCDHWALLGTRAQTLLQDAHGLVITHGTDTLAYTSSLFTWWFGNCGKPVILTGSQYPINAPGSDGPANLQLALKAAAGTAPGVYVAFGGKLLPGVRVTKVDTQGLSAFDAPNGPGSPPEAMIPREGPSPLDANVMLLRLAPGMTPALVPRDLDGLVLEVYGAGGLPEQWAKAVSRWPFPTAVVSQCLRGGLALDRYTVGAAASEAGVLDGGDMTPEAAYTKLLWLLGRGLRGDMLRAAFEANLYGERS